MLRSCALAVIAFLLVGSPANATTTFSGSYGSSDVVTLMFAGPLPGYGMYISATTSSPVAGMWSVYDRLYFYSYRDVGGDYNFENGEDLRTQSTDVYGLSSADFIWTTQPEHCTVTYTLLQGCPMLTLGTQVTFNLQSSDSAGTYSVSVLDFPLSAVPEPATWMMMMLGLALVGGVMRRKGSTAFA